MCAPVSPPVIVEVEKISEGCIVQTVTKMTMSTTTLSSTRTGVKKSRSRLITSDLFAEEVAQLTQQR